MPRTELPTPPLGVAHYRRLLESAVAERQLFPPAEPGRMETGRRGVLARVAAYAGRRLQQTPEGQGIRKELHDKAMATAERSDATPIEKAIAGETYRFLGYSQ